MISGIKSVIVLKKNLKKNYNNKFLKTKIRSYNLAIYIIEALFFTMNFKRTYF